MENKDDLDFERLFVTAELADEGFSERVAVRVNKLRRLRQISLVIAMLTGAMIAFQPFLELLGSIANLLTDIPLKWSELPIDSLLTMPSVFIPVMSIILLFILFPLMED